MLKKNTKKQEWSGKDDEHTFYTHSLTHSPSISLTLCLCLSLTLYSRFYCADVFNSSHSSYSFSEYTYHFHYLSVSVPPQNHMVQLISLWFYLYLRSEYLVSTICFNFVVEHISHWVYSWRARIQAFIAYTHHFVCQFSSQKLTYTHNCILIFAKIVAVYFKN